MHSGAGGRGVALGVFILSESKRRHHLLFNGAKNVVGFKAGI